MSDVDDHAPPGLVDDVEAWVGDAGESLGRSVDARRPRRDFADVLRRASGMGAVEIAEGELTGFVADAREGLDRRIDAAPQLASFGDAMVRAHALDPNAVGVDKLAEAQRLAPVVDLQRRSAGERALEAFVDDARAGVQSKIEARGRASAGSVAGARDSKVRRIATVVALAAAAILVASLAVVPDVLEQDSGQGAADAEQAQLIEEHDEREGEAARIGPKRVEPVRTAEPAVEDATSEEPEPESEPEPEKLRRPRAIERRADPLSLSELAALAKEQWRAGELAAAEHTLAQIVARGGTSRWADNAFSDLFALAHRRDDARAQQQWWRAYLRRFPRGRFADDAQAGLCRATSQRACWAKYLERFPDGSYRGEARRMVKPE